MTFYSVMWKAGLVNGYQRVQDTLVLSESGDEYTGHAQVDFLDANWKVVFSTTSDVKGTRLETPNPAMLVAQAAEKKLGGLGNKDQCRLGVGSQSMSGLIFLARGRQLHSGQGNAPHRFQRCKRVGERDRLRATADW